uniref:Sulfite exporter TauE/SafE family protein n=1 Tax=Kalanchoe fedtschenkoi TaxID=63787 RepID=A0A7N0ULE8_KALFE
MSSLKRLKRCTPMSWFILFFAIFIVFSQSQAKETHPVSGRVSRIYSSQLLDTVQQWRDYLAQPQDSRMEWSFAVVLAGVFCFLAASISSAGGIGGGGLYLPILTIVAGLSLKTASSFSAFMVTGGSIANVVYYLYISCGSKSGGRALIDYDVAILSQPCMLLGVSIGVICNVMFPEWLITALFAVFLAWTTAKTCRRGVFFWRAESDLARRKGLVKLENGLGEGESCEQTKSLKEPILAAENSEDCSRGIPWQKLGVLSVIWCSFSILYLLRGNKSGQSITNFKPCGLGYWVLTSLQIPLALVFTMWILLRRRNQNTNLEDAGGAITDDPSSMIIFPLLALLAGYLGGVFGIGGGMLISPLLLQTGMAPEVTAATCSFMVFFSSTMSAFQYLFLGMDNVDVALIFSAVCFIASVLGLVIVQKAIQQYGRASMIVFSVSTVMALSTVLITSFGALDVYRDYMSGKPMGFNLPC